MLWRSKASPGFCTYFATAKKRLLNLFCFMQNNFCFEENQEAVLQANDFKTK
jgi:hypothetical protein